MKLGLLTRLFTANSGKPDHEVAPSDSAYAALFSATHSWDEFERRLDLAQEVGITHLEFTQAGNPSGAEYLLANRDGRKRFVSALEQRGLMIEALNCSGMPMHPSDGERHRKLIFTTITLAQELGVEKIIAMSGVGGDGGDASTVNWAFYPWPPSSVRLAERQWSDALQFWSTVATFARGQGVSKIGLELHPVHLVYNVPTLARLRDAVGETIGATVDPSHLFWQQMDPAAVVKALAGALYHVQLKDAQFLPAEVALAGVLDDRPFTSSSRAWVQRTVGQGHDAAFWATFVAAIVDAGYEGALSIENEDPHQSYEDGVREAAAFMRPLMEV